jgi:hypothetical protein
MSAAGCTHLGEITVRELPTSVEGCEDCLRTGGKWLHLRICLICGHVACCDDSPNRHASAHAHVTSHPIIRSLEPGEDWSWCYVDDVAFIVDGIRGTTRIPPVAAHAIDRAFRSLGDGDALIPRFLRARAGAQSCQDAQPTTRTERAARRSRAFPGQAPRPVARWGQAGLRATRRHGVYEGAGLSG